MTHFAVVVFTKDRDDAMGSVEQLLAPYDEQGEWFAEGSKWDWWVLGGRWEGAMVNERPVTVRVPCGLCGATGKRDRAELVSKDPRYADDKEYAEWVEWCGGCNGCGGEGYREELAGSIYGSPPGFGEQQARRNILEATAIHPDFVPAAFVTPTGEWVEAGAIGWFGVGSDAKEQEGWKNQWEQGKARYADCLAVLVDCHV